MKIIDCDQGTAEWHAWRDGGLTASELSVWLGTSPFKSKWQLWAEKSGVRQPDDLDLNPYVRRGRDYEHMLREKVSADRKIGIMPMCVEYEPNTLVKASLDGIDRFGRPWEFKVPSERKFEEVRKLREKSESAITYWPQVQHQMLCTGANEGYLVFGLLGERSDGEVYIAEYIVLPIQRDADFLSKVPSLADAFHDDIVNGNEPDKDPSRDVLIPVSPEDAEKWRKEAARLGPLLLRKKEISDELKEIEDSLKSLGEPIKEVLGDFHFGEFAGIRAVQSTRKGSIDWKAYARSKGDDPEDEALFDQFRKDESKSVTYKLIGKE